MPARATLLFLILIAAPLMLIVWLGSMLVNEQHQQARQRFISVAQERLNTQRRLIEDEMLRLADAFDALLVNSPLSPTDLRDLPRHQPLIRHAFLLDAKGKLLFPVAQTSSADSEAAAFLRRSESVWENGLQPSRASADTEDLSPAIPVQNDLQAINHAPLPTDQQSWTVLKSSRASSAMPQAAKVGKGKNAPLYNSSGWHLWFHGNGPRLLFWQQRPNQQIVGVELEMPALMSLLFNRLPGSHEELPAGVVRLMAADGNTVLHQWGASPVEQTQPAIAETRCAPPLNMWRLDYLPAIAETPQRETLPVLFGAGAAGVVLLFVAWIFYRESTREMREARRRVSFVNQVSHELKTPLTNIRLYTDMAQQQANHHDDPSLQRHLDVVDAETSRLSRLIHNVLTFARQQRDQLTIHPQLQSLDEVAHRVVETWRPCLEAHGFLMTFEAQAEKPFLFDADAIAQILGNLLSNVEKYAAEGKQVMMRSHQNAQETTLTVEDRGPGIPAAQLETIFAPFTRVRSDLTEGVSGTGIGLSIARELARLHGGTLTASKLDQGARFTLSLPFKIPNS